MIKVRFAALLSILLTLGCNSTKEPDQPNILAAFKDGVITTQDLDQMILAMPPEDRATSPQERVAWFKQLSRELAVGRILIARAQEDGTLDSPEFQSLAHQVAREIALQDFLNRNLPPYQIPTNDQLKQDFSATYGDGYQSARAMVSHIFKRYQPNLSKAQISQTLSDLRDRILKGENFGQLAAKYSDSETRHRQGSLGFLRADQMPPDLRKVIFSLLENQPSQPIFTKEGGHLFFSEGIIPEKTITFEEVRSELLRTHAQNWMLGQIKVLSEQFVQPQPYICPQESDFIKRVTHPDPAETLLQMGTFTLSWQAFFAHLKEVSKNSKNLKEMTPQDLYQELCTLAAKERIFQAIQPDTQPADPIETAIFEQKRDQLWSAQLTQTHLLNTLLQEPEKLRAYYENQKSRFVTPPQVNLLLLTLPFTSQANELMTFMESHQKELLSGEKSLVDWQAQLGGNLVETGYVASTILERRDPELLAFAFQVPIGGYSPPFRRANGLSIFKVLEFVPPQPQPFSTILPALAQDYLSFQGQVEYQKFADQLLLDAQFKFFSAVAEDHGLLHLAGQ